MLNVHNLPFCLGYCCVVFITAIVVPITSVLVFFLSKYHSLYKLNELPSLASKTFVSGNQCLTISLASPMKAPDRCIGFEVIFAVSEFQIKI